MKNKCMQQAGSRSDSRGAGSKPDRLIQRPLGRANSILWLLILFMWPLFVPVQAQEARVNHRKIERERARKKKQELKVYRTAVKRHNKMQSKATRASMKKTKKECGKVTPIRP